MTNSPVLFLIFNRPDNTKKVFEKIRDAKPPKLYIASDGPRVHVPNESETVHTLRKEIIAQIDWKCNTYTLFREKNMGCKLAVSSAITWFFENEAEGIILEDDCLPSMDFFTYCDELLARYRDSERVMCISGDATYRHPDSPVKHDNGYTFSRYPLIWGWASWRRAWKKYDADIKNDYTQDGQKLLNNWFQNKHVREYWNDVFFRLTAGKINTWDFQWTWTILKENGLACVPYSNLISNIGFGKIATHTGNKSNPRANRNIDTLQYPLHHPETISSDVCLDKEIEENVFRIEYRYSLKGFIRVWLKRLRQIVIRVQMKY